MSEYQRFVSYFYEYCNNEKSKNCGFVRTEIRNQQCNMDIHLKIPVYPFTPVFTVYGFIPEKEQLTGILLGQGTCLHGLFHVVLSTPEKNVAETSYSIHDLGGLLIQCETGQIFATAWKEIPIRPELFTPFSKEESISAASLETPCEKTLLASSKTPCEETLSKSSETIIPTEDVLSSSQKQTSRKNISKSTTPYDTWGEIQRTYPHIQPFFDDEIHQCVKISTDDFPKLAEYGFFIDNNQFLSHGCHMYQHILLGKLDRKDSKDYILAVPGTYNEKECFLASMFGFPNFKPSRNPLVRPGQFGYWYRLLY